MKTKHLHKFTIEEQLDAVALYRQKHGDQTFNGITLAALTEKYGEEVSWIRGKGFVQLAPVRFRAVWVGTQPTYPPLRPRHPGFVERNEHDRPPDPHRASKGLSFPWKFYATIKGRASDGKWHFFVRDHEIEFPDKKPKAKTCEK